MWDDLDIQQKSELMRLFIKNNIYSLDKMKEMYNDTTERQYSSGGQIHIEPSKRGTFKAQASRMGLTVQEAASHILANKGNYSPAMVKKANFARNFAHADGGNLFFTGGPFATDPPTYNFGLPLATGTAGAWGDAKQTEADKQFEKEFKEAQEKYQKNVAKVLKKAAAGEKLTTKERLGIYTPRTDYPNHDFIGRVGSAIGKFEVDDKTSAFLHAFNNDNYGKYTGFLTTAEGEDPFVVSKYPIDTDYLKDPYMIGLGYGPADLFMNRNKVPNGFTRVSNHNVFHEYDKYLKNNYPNKNIPVYVVHPYSDQFYERVPFYEFEPDTSFSSKMSFPFLNGNQNNKMYIDSGGDYIDIKTDDRGNIYYRFRDMWDYKNLGKQYTGEGAKGVFKKTAANILNSMGYPFIYVTDWYKGYPRLGIDKGMDDTTKAQFIDYIYKHSLMYNNYIFKK